MTIPQQAIKLTIPKDKVLSRLGIIKYSDGNSARISDLIDEEIELAKKLAEPKQSIAFEKFSFVVPDEIEIFDSFKIKSKNIAELVKDCFSIYAFAITLGRHLEEKRDQYIKDQQSTRALLLDAAGSVAAEEAAEITNKEISEEAKLSGFSTTHRFSPGFGDWPLSAQVELLEWLGADRIGISLSDKFTMIPEKSVSAIIGIRGSI